MLHVTLNGWGPPGFVPSERLELDLRVAEREYPPAQRVAVRDAAAAGDGGNGGPLRRRSRFRPAPPRERGSGLEAECGGSAEQRIGCIYVGEIDKVIRERLLPGRRLLIWQHPVLTRRGEGTSTPQYGTGVHQDHALAADDYRLNVAAFAGERMGAMWRQRYEQDDVLGVMSINFWRTTNMDGPLLHMPLAVCDPASVAADEIIQFAMTGIAPEGRVTHTMGLRYSPDHLWYYYPRMTGDELLAFKIFQCMKADAEPRLATCFHSAFEHPDTPEDAQKRQSCEHRVNVFLLKDDG
jgi:hypothetical protein